MTHRRNQFLDWYKPGIGESWMTALLLLMSALIVGIIISLAGKIAPASAHILDSQSLSYILVLLIPAIYVASRAHSAKKRAVPEVDEPVPVNTPLSGRADAGLVFPLAAMGMIALSVLIEPLSLLVPMPDSFKAIFEEAFINSPLWDVILSACILAPLLEELLCRGIMLRGMLQKSSPWKAIAWSALIFAVIHMNIWQAVPAFVFGLFLGWLYWRTGCLWITIFLHFLNNSISVALTRIYTDISVDQGLIDLLPRGIYLIVYAVCAVLFAAAVIMLRKRLPSKALQNR